MKMKLLLLIFGILSSTTAFSTRQKFNSEDFKLQPGADYGEPLFLTPYIDEGRIAEGRNASLVGPLNGTERISFSGYLTVNPTYNSNLFFWYFPAEVNPSTAPVVVWLQGGPGSSSMFGLFVENGPFAIDSNLNLYERDFDWGVQFNLVFFDNPVGAGFSFTDDDAGYANNQTDVANNLYEALLQFFTLYPELQPLDFYVTGESYGGKYIPAIAYKIITENPTASLIINLKGIAIGDGWIDPETQFDYGDYLYNVGLIDAKQREPFYDQQIEMVENIHAGNWLAATNNSDQLINIYIYYSHLFDYYNYLRWNEPQDQNYYYDYLQKPEVRKSIHVGNLTFSDGNDCYDHLEADMCKSTKSWLEIILNNNYKVLLYNGQVDIIVAYYLTVNMINTLQWNGAADYKQAKRTIWKVYPEDTEIAGYIKNVSNFWEIVVRNAGHILPYDQPSNAYHMINSFVFDLPFNN